ncbi:MAG: hypothetical protein AABM33_05910 [Pseudomonadota bacterium]
MLIRSKLERNKPGINPPEPVTSFVVEFGKDRERKYTFTLDEDGDHVCDVQRAEDAQALLAIPEGYEMHPTTLAKLNLSSDGNANRGPWQPNTAYEAEDFLVAANGMRQTVSTGGTSGAVQPQFNQEHNGRTTDGTVTWVATSDLREERTTSRPERERGRPRR